MRSILLVLVLMISVIAIGCRRNEATEPPAETTTVEQSGTSSPADVSPPVAQMWIDDVTIGHELAADGSMVAGRTGDDFAPGQPVIVTMAVGDAPAASVVKVVWYGPGETKIGEDNKPVVAGQKYLPFTSTDTKKWAKGDYRAEVWIGDEKVNTQQFQIVDASKAGK